MLDFEAATQKVVPPAHWGYLIIGVEGVATQSSFSIEDVAKGRAAAATALVKRAQAAGCPAVAVTVAPRALRRTRARPG